jgi:very-short-patch-repair endonuclease
MTAAASLPVGAPTWRHLLSAQASVLARRQALASGMSEHAWDWRHSSGRWTALLPGVSVSHTGEPTDEQLAWAAVLHCGQGAALTGDWALVRQGFTLAERPTRVHVAVPEGRGVRRGARLLADPPVLVVPHQVRRLDELVHPARFPAVVRVPPAALHAAAHAPSDRAAEWRIAAVVQQRLTGPAQLTAALDRLPTLRRRALVRTVLADVAHGAHAQSELDFVRLLRRNDLPRPDRLQRLVRANGKRYLDAWWERQRVAAEIDGAHHVEVGQWDADTVRANAVVVAERQDRVLLLRFTTGNLRHDEPVVAGQLRTVLLP